MKFEMRLTILPRGKVMRHLAPLNLETICPPGTKGELISND